MPLCHFFVAILMALLGQKPLLSRENEDGLFPAVLVRAKVVEVNKKGRAHAVKFVIEHVYVGDKKLKRQHFNLKFDRSTWNIQTRIGPAFLPDFVKGEVDIWSLTKDPNEGCLTADLNFVGWEGRTVSPPLPGRQRVQQTPFDFAAQRWVSLQRAVNWAKRVEAVHSRKGGARVRLLRRFALDSDSRSAAWAVYSLETVNPRRLASLLQQLAANPQLSLGAQVAVDQVLSRISPRHWPLSEQRLQLLRQLVAGPIVDLENERHVLSRLEALAQHSSDEYRIFLDLAKIGLSNSKLAESFRCSLCLIADHSPQRDKNKRTAFSFWAGQVQAGQTEKFKRWAALALSDFIPLTTPQLQVVRSLRHNAANKDVGALLEAAVLKCDAHFKKLRNRQRTAELSLALLRGINNARGRAVVHLMLVYRLSLNRPASRFVDCLMEPAFNLATLGLETYCTRLTTSLERFRRNGAGFENAIILLKRAKTADQRFAACAALSSQVPLGKDQIIILRALLKETQDAYLTRELTDAIQRSEQPE